MSFPSFSKRALSASGIAVGTAVLVAFTVHAGSLTPPGPPSSTMYTLQDIYARLTTNATAGQGDGDFSPTGNPESTMKSLTAVYNAIPTINPAKVLTGTSYLGVSGTVFANLFNGTGQGIDGGTQTSGGIDDYNNGEAPPADRYAGPWTICTAGNNYCGTGLASAGARDDSTNLVWSAPCNGVGCASFSEESPLTYTWNNSGGNNDGKTAQELCTDGAHSEPGWLLPHQKQLMQAYVNGSYGNLEPVGASRNHWSASASSSNTALIWQTNLFHGFTSNHGKTNSFSVRCVRPAP